jgi:transposase
MVIEREEVDKGWKERMKEGYTSDLTDEEWSVLEPLLSELLRDKKRTCPLRWGYRKIVDGILYQLKNGCNWKDLPGDLPPYSTVY